MTVAQVVDWNQIIEEVSKDPKLLIFVQIFKKEAQAKPGWSLVGDQLKYKNRMVIPNSSKWKSKLLTEFHSSPIGGH